MYVFVEHVVPYVIAAGIYVSGEIKGYGNAMRVHHAAQPSVEPHDT